jgi:hypothetical protein
MIYVVTAKHKGLKAGMKLDIDQWLKDGWVIEKKERFPAPEKVEAAVISALGCTLNDLLNKYLPKSRDRRLLYYSLYTFTRMDITKISERYTDESKIVAFAIRAVDSLLQYDSETILLIDNIKELLGNEDN